MIKQDGRELLTDTRAVAIAFGKRHADVLRTIEKMLANERAPIAEHAQRNFALCSYVDSQGGRLRPMYRMTFKGLSELAMGFSGSAQHPKITPLLEPKHTPSPQFLARRRLL